MVAERKLDDQNPAEIDSKELTVEQASSVFTMSFMFSNNNDLLQEDFFVAINKLRPTWSLDDQMFDIVLEKTLPMCKSLILSDDRLNRHVTEQEVCLHIKEQLSLMQAKFTGFKEAKGLGDPLIIAQTMILEDLKSYYCLEESSTKNEQYSSLFCKYVLEQEHTGLNVFDSLFEAVKRDFDAVDLKDKTLLKKYKYIFLLKDVARWHFDANPEKIDIYQPLLSDLD